MGVLAYDGIGLREPRLIMPRKMPLGPVRVDPLHPLSRGLMSGALCVGPQQVLPAFGKYPGPWTIVAGSARNTMAVDAYGNPCIRATANSRDYYSRPLMPEFNGALEATMLAIFKPVASSSNPVAIIQSHGYNAVTLAANALSVSWRVRSAASTYTDGTITVATGVLYVLVASWTASNPSVMDMDLNGSPATVTYANSGIPTQIAQSGTAAQLLATGIVSDCEVTAAAMWNRYMSAGERQELATNPFQMLVPS